MRLTMRQILILVNFAKLNIANLFVYHTKSSKNVVWKPDPRHFLPIIIKGKIIWVLIDSGSTRTYFGKDMIPHLSEALLPCNATVTVANNAVETVSGEVQIGFTI